VLQQQGTYSQVISAARDFEQVMEKENKSRLQARPLKRPLNQVTRGSPVRFSVAPPSRRPITLTPPTMIRDFCQRTRHLRKNCMRANGQCLAYGSRDHQLADCPIKGQRTTIPTLPAPGVKKNPAPAGIGTPLSPQLQLFEQAQRRTRAGRGRGHAFNLTAEQVEASEEVVAGTILVQSFLAISLFDSGASHCYISTKFVKMHYIRYDDIDTQ